MLRRNNSKQILLSHLKYEKNHLLFVFLIIFFAKTNASEISQAIKFQTQEITAAEYVNFLVLNNGMLLVKN